MNNLGFVWETIIYLTGFWVLFQGLIYVDENGGLTVVKKAKLFHKYKHDVLNVISQFCRMMTERKYLGCCRMTYENNIKKERNAQRKIDKLTNF